MTATDVPPALPPSLLATLGGRCYTDPGVFALETERVFAAMWQCVARADELPSPGRFVTVPVAAEERPAGPRPGRRAARLLQRVPAPRRPAVHRGQRRGPAGAALHLPRVDVRPEHHLAGFHDWLRDRLATPG